jgi:hypothetical protein
VGYFNETLLQWFDILSHVDLDGFGLLVNGTDIWVSQGSHLDLINTVSKSFISLPLYVAGTGYGFFLYNNKIYSYGCFQEKIAYWINGTQPTPASPTPIYRTSAPTSSTSFLTTTENNNDNMNAIIVVGVVVFLLIVVMFLVLFFIIRKRKSKNEQKQSTTEVPLTTPTNVQTHQQNQSQHFGITTNKSDENKEVSSSKQNFSANSIQNRNEMLVKTPSVIALTDNIQKWMMEYNEIELEKKIGSGNFGEVWKGKNVNFGCLC